MERTFVAGYTRPLHLNPELYSRKQRLTALGKFSLDDPAWDYEPAVSFACQYPAERQAEILPADQGGRHPYNGNRPQWSGYCTVDSCVCECHGRKAQNGSVDAAAVRAMRAKGYSFREIAAVCGISRMRASRICAGTQKALRRPYGCPKHRDTRSIQTPPWDGPTAQQDTL